MDVREAKDYVDSIVAAAERNRERYAAARAAVTAAEVTVSEMDGAVEVTVGSAGELRDVRFSERAVSLGPGRLAGALMSATRQAQARLADRVGEAMAEHVPAHDLIAQQVVAKTRERFPSPERETPRAPAEAEPEDFSTRSYLDRGEQR